MNQEVVISDLGTCLPASSLCPEWCDGKWMLLDYETDIGISGRMLYYTYYPVFQAAMRRPQGEIFVNPPPVTLPLNVSGRYDIHLGMHYASTARLDGPQILVRLAGDDAYATIGREQCQPKDGDFAEKSGFGIFDMAEVFWCTADLGDQDLIIAPPVDYYGTDQYFANLAYVRLVPVDDERPARFASHRSEDGPDPSPASTSDTSPSTSQQNLDLVTENRLVAYYGGPPRTRTAAIDWIDCFADTDFGLVLWGTGGDADSEVARTAIERAHEHGLQIYASVRFSGLKMDNYLPIHEIYAEYSLGSSIVTDHPEWRKLSPQGLPTNSMSLAFPEVQDFWLAEIERVLAWGFDGINIVTARCFPFVLYEDPVVQTFIDQFGEDPRSLPADDERWIHHRAQIVTDFIRRIRHLADSVGAQRGTKLGTAYHTMNSPANSLFFTIDAATWMQEGLMDHCIVHPCHSAAPGMPDPGAIEADLLAQFVSARGESPCRIYADIYPRRMPAEGYRLKALEYYAAGIDGLSLWDTHARRTRASEWSMIRRLGHREQLEQWREDTDGLFRRSTLSTLQGITTDRAYSFTDG